MANNPRRYTIEDAMRAENIAPPPKPAQPQFNYGFQYAPYGVMQNQYYPSQSLLYPPCKNITKLEQPVVIQQSQSRFYSSQPQYIPQPQNIMQPQQQQQQQQQKVAPQPFSLSKPQQIQEFLPPVDESELDQESRWDQEIKIYSYLYRKLNIIIPNIASAKFCNSREVFQEQTLTSVRLYVERAFTKCQSDEERNTMEQYLKNTISEAKRKNEYNSRDWAKFPLPTLPRENQIRTQAQPLPLKSSTTAVLSSLQVTSKFGAPSQPIVSGPAQIATNLSNLTQLSDIMKQQQIDRINLNYIKKKPMESSMDFLMLQASKLQPNVKNVTTQLKIEQKQLKKKFEEEDKIKISDQKIIGTCEDLEKPYFRLTGLPDPNIIRPEHILKKSLIFILNKWKDGQVQYDYIVEQFRSIRQDLLVQHIENHFTVQVYEDNARICLECGDFPRYETCWTMLCDLYDMISISESKNVNQIGNKIEFDSYRIVYLTMWNKQDQLVKILHQIADDPRIKFALEIRESYKCGNYVKLFQKYKEAPETMSSVINHFLIRIRVKALRQIVKTFIGTVELIYLQELLAFQDLPQFKQFLTYFDQVRFDETCSSLNVRLSVNAFDQFNFDKMNE